MIRDFALVNEGQKQALRVSENFGTQYEIERLNMKYLILVTFGAGVVVGSALYLSHARTTGSTEVQPSVSMPGNEQIAVEQPRLSPDFLPPTRPVQTSMEKSVPITAKPLSPEPVRLDAAVIAQALDLLLSSQVPYDQKRAAWKQLQDTGGLDQAIADLQQRLTNNPADADCAAVLGHAYLKKCATTSDIREQGILAMQADKLFDTALNLDPQNWEARFTKAVALSYWPASMGKGDEVINLFSTLIQQQEGQPQQPQFADSYLWLGDQYKKLGHLDDAQSIWQRGVALFPSDQKLAGRLTGSN